MRELLSDEQIATAELLARSGDAVCLGCGTTLDPSVSDAAVVLLVDESRRRAAVRVAHPGCLESAVVTADLDDPPGPARMAERWAAFVLPRVPLLVLETRADIWTSEDRPALHEMLIELGFEPARELLDSDLFATGVGKPPTARGLTITPREADAILALDRGAVLETLPGALAGGLGDLAAERGGVAVALGVGLGLPDGSSSAPLTFEELLPALLDRGLGAFLPIGPAVSGDPTGAPAA